MKVDTPGGLSGARQELAVMAGDDGTPDGADHSTDGAAPGYSWPPRKVLVGYEERDRSHAAWRVAVEIARQHRSELLVLHVVDLPREAALRMNADERASMVRVNQDRFRFLADECKVAGVTASLEVDLGQPVSSLSAQSVSFGADLVVLGTLQHGPLVSWLTEEVSTNVVPRLHVPILLVPSHVRPPYQARPTT